MDIELLLDIEPKHLAIVKHILATYLPSNTVWAYGSRVKFTAHKNSDLDLVAFDAAPNAIADAVEAFENSALPYNVSIMLWKKIPADFQANISQKYVIINEPALKEHINSEGIEAESGWKKCRLGDIVELIGGGTPSTSNPEYWGGDIPWLSVTDFNTGLKYCFDAEKKITEKGLKESSTKILKKGQIIISARGTVGVISMLGRDMAFNQSNYGINAKEDLTSNEFLYYLLKANLANFISVAYGAVFDTITKQTFSQITVLLPPLTVQTAIASILSSLDDKIDLLHRQNKTLEQLAETLFRKWFVEGAEESWEIGTVLDLFKLQRGFDLPTQNRIEGKYPIVTSSGVTETHNEFKVKAPGVTTGRSGSLGDVFYIEEDFWPLNTSLYVSEFNRATPLFTFFFLKTLDLKSLNGGSAVPTLNRNNVHELETELPPIKLIQEFEEIAKAYFQKIKSNQTQIRTLTQTRDTLLPKLMSGEVRVKFV
ncbi:MAG: restriction endonuclease subunit S [Flavobacterium sp.]|nr:restriction endonuclease subunit S [Flavobacterium sp.]